MAKNLFFGQYLIGRDLVSEEQVVEALELQRRNTTAFEKMAFRLSLLSMKEIFRLLTEQASTDLSIPEVAVRSGLLSTDQVLFILQNIDQERPTLGTILVQLGHIDQKSMSAELERFEEQKRQYEAIADILSRISIFKRLDNDALEALSYISTKRQYDAGDIVVNEGDPADSFYCVATGSVRVTTTPHHGSGESVYLGHLATNDLFGESSIFEDATRNATITCEESSLLLRIGRREFLHFLKDYPAASQSVLIFIIQRLLKKLAFANSELAYERQNFLDQQGIESLLDSFYEPKQPLPST
jgi:CRP-like cAMP-binding protein